MAQSALDWVRQIAFWTVARERPRERGRSAAMDPEGEGFWTPTQEALQPTAGDALVERPRLTAKLLARPPFRFLHDLISEVGGPKKRGCRAKTAKFCLRGRRETARDCRNAPADRHARVARVGRRRCRVGRASRLACTRVPSSTAAH